MVFRYAVELNYPNGGGPGVNVWHLRGDTVGSDVQQAVTAIDDFYGFIFPLFQPSTVITGPDEIVADIETSSPTFQPVDGWSYTTASAGESAPPVLSIVAGWRTSSASRSGRGRTFLGPFNSSVLQANGTPSDEAMTNIRAACQSIVDFNGGVDVGAIGVWSPSDGVLRDITSATVRDVFAVLRSRRD